MILFTRKEGHYLDFRIPCEKSAIQTRLTEQLCWALLVLSTSVRSICKCGQGRQAQDWDLLNTLEMENMFSRIMKKKSKANNLSLIMLGLSLSLFCTGLQRMASCRFKLLSQNMQLGSAHTWIEPIFICKSSSTKSTREQVSCFKALCC